MFNINQKFDILNNLTTMVVANLTPSLLVTGDPGMGKTQSVTSTIEDNDMTSDDYIFFKGYSTARGLYNTLYENNGKLIIFDDCDSILEDKVALNILKSALDSYEKRTISWMAKMTKKILISDPTLRDGNHAVRHQLSRENFIDYCQAAEAAGVPIVEVGHGNGLGASSLLIGECKLTDEEILSISRANLKKSKLAIHLIPGFCTIKSDLARAVDLGVDIFRVGSHCTEADVTDRHIAYARKAGKEAYGVLMMSHMASPEILLEEAKKMESYGAEAIVIMDSAGAYFPDDVTKRITTLVEGLSIPVGFHGHNNLGMAVINSVVAVKAGATIIDGSIRGFGAGAGNTQLEVLIAVFERLGFEPGIDLYKILVKTDCLQIVLKPS
jgi:4-hydroxy 2-oxovalerate aldolase